MQTSVTNYSFCEDWYNAFLKRNGDTVQSASSNRKRKVTKPLFGQMVGFQNYSEMRNNWENCSDKIAFFDKHLKHLGDHFTESYIELLMRLVRNEKVTVSERLLLDVYRKKLSQADYDYYHSKQHGDMPVSLITHLQKIFTPESIRGEFKLSRYDIAYIKKRIWPSLDPKTKFFLISSKEEIAAMPFHEFKSLSQEILEMMNTGRLFNLTWGRDSGDRKYRVTLNWILAEMLRLSILSYDELISMIQVYFDAKKDECRSYYNLHPIAAKVKNIDDLEKAKVGMMMEIFSGEISKEDKKVLSFYIEHCKAPKIKRSKQRDPFSLEGLYGYSTPSSSSQADIDFLLMSTSVLTAPVLATYLLYSVGESIFNAERFLACLYVISKQDVLRALCEKLEPIIKLEQTHSFVDEELYNPLIAAFILINKISHLNSSEGFTSYYKYLRSLLIAGHYGMVLGEHSRLIEYTMLTIETPAYREAFVTALSCMSDSEINQLDPNVKRGVFFSLARNGVMHEKLFPFMNEEELDQAMFLMDERIHKVMALDLSSAGKLIHGLEGLSQNEYHLGGVGKIRGDNEASLERVLVIAKAARNDLRKHEDIPVRRFKCFEYGENHYHMRRGIQYFKEDGFTQKQASLYERLKEQRRELTPYQFVRLYEDGYVLKRHYVEAGSYCTCALKDSQMMIVGYIEQKELLKALIEYRPTKVTILDPKGTLDPSYSDKDMLHLYGADGVLELSNIADPLVESVHTYEKLCSDLCLHSYVGLNPLADISKTMAPRFGFNGVNFNADGTEYNRKVEDQD